MVLIAPPNKNYLRLGAHLFLSMNVDYKFKILIIGRKAVGKTSLMRRYVDDKFSESYVSSMLTDFMTKDVNYKGNVVRLLIYELAGQDKYAAHQISEFKKVDYICSVASFDDQDSMKKLPFIMKRAISTYRDQNGGNNHVPITIVLNKLDLVSGEERTALRYGFKRSVASLTKNIQKDGILFTSAKTGAGVQVLFNKMATRLIQERC